MVLATLTPAATLATTSAPLVVMRRNADGSHSRVSLEVGTDLLVRKAKAAKIWKIETDEGTFYASPKYLLAATL